MKIYDAHKIITVCVSESEAGADCASANLVEIFVEFDRRIPESLSQIVVVLVRYVQELHASSTKVGHLTCKTRTPTNSGTRRSATRSRRKRFQFRCTLLRLIIGAIL